MMIRNYNPRSRRGVVLVEAAILYPVFLLLFLGTLVVTLGMFRHSQLASLSWEGARWASVRGRDHQNHGPDYTRDQTLPAPSAEDIGAQLDVDVPTGFNLKRSELVSILDSDLTMVALGYEWKPEYNPPVGDEDGETGEPPRRLFDSVIPLRGSSKMPTLYFRTD